MSMQETEIVPIDEDEGWYHDPWDENLYPLPDSWDYDEMLIVPVSEPEPFDPNEHEPIDNVVSPIVIELLNNDLVPQIPACTWPEDSSEPVCDWPGEEEEDDCCGNQCADPCEGEGYEAFQAAAETANHIAEVTATHAVVDEDLSVEEAAQLKQLIEADYMDVLEDAIEEGHVDQEDLQHDVAVNETAAEVLDSLEEQAD